MSNFQHIMTIELFINIMETKGKITTMVGNSFRPSNEMKMCYLMFTIILVNNPGSSQMERQGGKIMQWPQIL